MSGALELKCKRNRLGWKKRFPVAALRLRPDSWPEVVAALREQAPDEARPWLDSYARPVLINRYHRRYFVTACGRVRMTLDTEQCVYDQVLSASPNLTACANLPEVIILEIKGAVEHHLAVSEVIQGIPMRAGRHSKYVVGLQAWLGA